LALLVVLIGFILEADMEAGWVRSRGQHFAFIYREGEGFPILFLPGSGYSKKVFWNQFKSPVLSKRHLIALDLPGHGESSDALDPSSTYSYRGFAQSVLEFLEMSEIDKCIIAGWSLGGQVAIELIDSSPRIAGVMAFGAPPATTGPLGILSSMHFSRILLLASKPVFTHADAALFEQLTLAGFGRGRFLRDLLRVDSQMRSNVSRSVLFSRGQGQRQRVEQAATPVCFVNGEHEPLVRHGYMDRISSAALFGGKVHRIGDCGHAPFVERPEEFDLLLNQFADYVESHPANMPLALLNRPGFTKGLFV
jgi:pimeloyl-ACP methyl ester carboxylesterase